MADSMAWDRIALGNNKAEPKARMVVFLARNMDSDSFNHLSVAILVGLFV